MHNGKPIRGSGRGISCINPDGEVKFLEFYTEAEDRKKALEDYKKSLEEKGYKILDTCIGFLN